MKIIPRLWNPIKGPPARAHWLAECLQLAGSLMTPMFPPEDSQQWPCLPITAALWEDSHRPTTENSSAQDARLGDSHPSSCRSLQGSDRNAEHQGLP